VLFRRVPAGRLGNGRPRSFIAVRPKVSRSVLRRRGGSAWLSGPSVFTSITPSERRRGAFSVLPVACVTFCRRALGLVPPENHFLVVPTMSSRPPEKAEVLKPIFRGDVAVSNLGRPIDLLTVLLLDRPEPRRALFEVALSGRRLRGAKRCVAVRSATVCHRVTDTSPHGAKPFG